MVDLQVAYDTILRLFADADIPYQLYHHRPVLSYEEAELARQEVGFEGTEGKVVVCRIDDGFAVYVTMQGQRLDQRALKRLLGARKLRLATVDEVREAFGAEPGCAYPFGFAADIPIVFDRSIFDEEWMLFSAALPTTTIQVAGQDLRSLVSHLPNRTLEHGQTPSSSPLSGLRPTPRTPERWSPRHRSERGRAV